MILRFQFLKAKRIDVADAAIACEWTDRDTTNATLTPVGGWRQKTLVLDREIVGINNGGREIGR